MGMLSPRKTDGISDVVLLTPDGAGGRGELVEARSLGISQVDPHRFVVILPYPWNNPICRYLLLA